MKTKLIKLINVKSIVTIVLTAVFAYLAVTSKIAPNEFLTIFVTIISFYFGTQKQKEDDKQ